MVIKRLAIFVFVLLTAAVLWRLKDAQFVQEFFIPSTTTPAKIKFDNGTVRKYASPSAEVGNGANELLPTHAMRKCVRGTEVLYTNNTCPPKSREQKIEKGTVNTYKQEKREVKKPFTHPLHNLDPNGTGIPEETLRQKAIDRVVNQ